MLAMTMRKGQDSITHARDADTFRRLGSGEAGMVEEKGGGGMNRLEVVKPNHHPDRSPCCKKTLYMSIGDGVVIGSCSRCRKNVIRINPRTGNQEWLHGESPWTEQDAE